MVGRSRKLSTITFQFHLLPSLLTDRSRCSNLVPVVKKLFLSYAAGLPNLHYLIIFLLQQLILREEGIPRKEIAGLIFVSVNNSVNTVITRNLDTNKFILRKFFYSRKIVTCNYREGCQRWVFRENETNFYLLKSLLLIVPCRMTVIANIT